MVAKKSPFSKLTLCPKATTVCSKTAEKFPQRRKRNLRSEGVLPPYMTFPNNMLREVLSFFMSVSYGGICPCFHLAPTASNLQTLSTRVPGLHLHSTL